MTKNEATMMMGLGLILVSMANAEMQETRTKKFRFDTKRRMSWVNFGSKLCDLCFSGKISEKEYDKYNEQAWSIMKKDVFSKEEKEIFLANLYEEILTA